MALMSTRIPVPVTITMRNVATRRGAGSSKGCGYRRT